MDWSQYPNFSANEFRCKHTGHVEMDPEFMARLQKLRTEWGLPMVITSGYRHKKHPIEARKRSTGAHTTGKAVDIAISGGMAVLFLQLALNHGFSGIGIQQKGGGRFIHLDTAFTSDLNGTPRPSIWSY